MYVGGGGSKSAGEIISMTGVKCKFRASLASLAQLRVAAQLLNTKEVLGRKQSSPISLDAAVALSRQENINPPHLAEISQVYEYSLSHSAGSMSENALVSVL